MNKVSLHKKEIQENIKLRKLRKEGIKLLRKDNLDRETKVKRWIKEEKENKVVKVGIKHKEVQDSKVE